MPESVHLCDYPQVDESRLDAELNWKSKQVQTLVRVAHRLRESAEQRVRQPLAELRYVAVDERQAAALDEFQATIADELNVKRIVRTESLEDLVTYVYKPNLKTLGPRYGKLLSVIKSELPNLPDGTLGPLRSGQPVTVTLDGQELTLQPEDVLVSTQQACDWQSAAEAGLQVALSTAITPELLREGMARDFVRHVQQSRKDADLEITDRISVQYHVSDLLAAQAIAEWDDYIRRETLADQLLQEQGPPAGSQGVSIGDSAVSLAIKRST